ncbi:MAG: citrate/2-methylcitrate synthase [Planctomycetes bacterium]|nr:citrate/2-methylcitrate synthase [Planctomycetota bacterium]
MTESRPNYSKGLAGVIADETALCLVQGEEGRLFYRGHSIDDLAMREFDEVAYLMLSGALPSQGELATYRSEIARAYALPDHARAAIAALPHDLHPMEVLQAVIPLLGTIRAREVSTERVTKGDEKITRVLHQDMHRADLIRIVGAIPTIIATFYRQRESLPPVEPDPSLDYLTNFLTMFHGKQPDPADVRVFGVAEILQMEHGFNASTFVARAVASTLAPIHACLAAAVGSLYGKLHGGADEAAFRMARDEIGSVARAEGYVDELLAKGGKIMGLGHRVYRTIDPRARILKRLATDLCAGKGGDKQEIFETLTRVEEVINARIAAKGKALYPNVEFYKGPVFHALDIPTDHFTAMFVLARGFGWGAHVLELYDDHRLYRPKAAYVGPLP